MPAYTPIKLDGVSTELAEKWLEPRVRVISVERATLRTADDGHGWTGRQQRRLLEAVRLGPIVIQ